MIRARPEVGGLVHQLGYEEDILVVMHENDCDPGGKTATVPAVSGRWALRLTKCILS